MFDDKFYAVMAEHDSLANKVETKNQKEPFTSSNNGLGSHVTKAVLVCLAYLRTSLAEEPLMLIHSFVLTDENYSVAWDTYWSDASPASRT
ncbi:hypothetical protein PR048_009471 [Dryococelus australis]|uniref:Uncharacterized protein n=1 Tax=Dryococelus australis TaxID=614101 RepID=A0ABQ9HZZ1_9NEOP|nr:hypothetical protein PR048_009471 [Dryococelus australis]